MGLNTSLAALDTHRVMGRSKEELRKADDPYIALMAYRATPLENGFSPAELLMGRKIRTLLPCSENNLIPQWPDFTKLQNTEETQKLKQRFWFNKRHRAKPLSSLQPGDPVWLQENGKPASVIQHADTPRSYIVETENGMLRRNRTQEVAHNPRGI